jgi:4-hydroxybenzoate polyprenyltransferase
LTITYLILTLSYSWYFKSAALIDTILLASLYTIRVITGAELICVDLSFWLISFSIFIFYSLALLKRVTELQDVKSRKTVAVAGREYTFQDLASIRTIGISSGFLSIVVFALYINSSDVLMLYSRPQVLWLICPIILYWINRIWLKTGRNEMHDDPIVFTIKDKGSLVMFAVGLLLMAIAS